MPQENSPDWNRVARLVLTSRTLDLIEVNELTPKGKIAYQFSAKGHELVQVLLGLQLAHPHDGAAVYYRSRPFMLSCGLTISEALAAGMARTGSPSEGRDVGVVFSMPPRSGATVLPASGDVGAQYTPAAGWAQAIRYRESVMNEADWAGAIAVALGGEGSTAANGFWAALNIVTTRNLPYLFFIEDNRFAISVRSDLQTPGANIAANLRAFNNLHILEGDGTDPVESAEMITAAVNYVRAGRGPCLLRMRVPRLTGHTFIDDQSYKSKQELIDESANDPIIQLKKYLTELDWTHLEKEVEADIRLAIDNVHGHPDPDPESAKKYLFFDGVHQIVGGCLPETGLINTPKGTTELQPERLRINLIDAVRKTIEVEMSINARVLIFGEDVGAKGGVHGATARMQEKFGDLRVFDTSLSEEGIMGSAVGMALAGLMPVPEIQFRKYADPAMEQINDTGTIRWRTAGKFAAPMVVRIPVGFGKKTGDPWHSVTGEAIFAHTLGWKLAFPSNAVDAVGLLRTALRGNDPVIFFEHRALLDTSIARRPYPGDSFVLPFGQAAITAKGEHLTVVSWGAMLHRCMEAAESFPGQVEIIDLRTIVPWDKETVLNSVKKTGKCLIVHEDTITGGFSGEIIAAITSEAFEWLDAPIKRLAVDDSPIPYNIGLMNKVIPSSEMIRTQIQELMDY